MKRLFMALIATTALIACSKTDPKPNNNGNTNGTTTTPTEQSAIEHYIAKFDLEDERFGPISTTTYHYDEQMRLVSLETQLKFNNQNLTLMGNLSYSPERILLAYEQNKQQNNLVKPTEFRLHLDPKGQRATKIEEELFFADSQEPDTRTEAIVTRNDQGLTTEHTSSFFPGIQLDWKNGNLTKVDYQNTEREERTYSEVKNNIYPDLNFLISNTEGSPQFKYLWTDQLGLRSKNLVTRTDNYSLPPHEHYYEEYKYDLDAKGRPSRITVTRSKGSSSAEIYTITYLEK